MTKSLVLFAIICFSFSALCQTKSIEFKRHSGQLTHFSKSLLLEGKAGGPSNLGMAPERWVRSSELKKVIRINDTLAAMVTEETCRDEYKNNPDTERWRAGTDTVIRHPVFSAEITTDSMRTILKKDYYFANDMKDVEFIGFKKESKKKKKQPRISQKTDEMKTVKTNQQQNNSWRKITLVSIIIASSLGIGLIKIR